MTWRVTRFPILPSTNDMALERLREGRAAAGDVLLAEEQVSGRGRPGRSWVSPKGSLSMTAVLPFWPDRVGWVALAAGLSAAQAVRDLGAPAGVKWPNDVTLRGRKLAGVLAETSAADLVAVGIGMNVTNPLPEDPALAARSARLGDDVSAVTVDSALEAILSRIERNWAILETGNTERLRREWAALDTTAGRRLRWSEQGITGTALGIDAAGRLLLRCSDGREIAASVGEVGFLD